MPPRRKIDNNADMSTRTRRVLRSGNLNLILCKVVSFPETAHQETRFGKCIVGSTVDVFVPFRGLRCYKVEVIAAIGQLSCRANPGGEKHNSRSTLNALTQPSDEAIASRPAAAHAWSCIPSGAPPTPMPAIDADPAFTVTPPARKRVPGRSAMVDPSPLVRCERSLVSAPKAAEVYAFSREASTVCWAALSPRTMAMTFPARSTTETVTKPSPSARHFARAAPAAFTAASVLSRF